MGQSKFTETQIVSILKKADAGRSVNEIRRQYGINLAVAFPLEFRVAESSPCDSDLGIPSKPVACFLQDREASRKRQWQLLYNALHYLGWGMMDNNR
jgi:hypothetical protein